MYHKRKLFHILLTALGLFVLTSCGAAEKQEEASAEVPEEAGGAITEVPEEAGGAITEAPAESAEEITEAPVEPEEEIAEEREEPVQVITEQEAFYITEITDDIWERIKGKSYKEDCTVPLEDLRYLHVLHKDIKGETREGEMICNVYIAETVLDILRKLYEADYPIEKIRLVDEYDADDEMSMRDNNSSSFNFRFVSHTKKISKHGYGLAVDINTLYNPYIKYVDGERVLEPATAEAYLDRDKVFPYKIEEGDLCWQLFTEAGFTWGGSWSSQKDYQHFEMPTDVVESLYP